MLTVDFTPFDNTVIQDQIKNVTQGDKQIATLKKSESILMLNFTQ